MGVLPDDAEGRGDAGFLVQSRTVADPAFHP